MKRIFADSHCHLYLDQFDQDRDQVVSMAIEEGVEKLYLPNIDSSTIDGMLQMESSHPGHCYPMMGLHPCSVKENYKEELALVKEWLDKREFCAIGETGLDYYWDTTFKSEQKAALQQQIEWAKASGLALVLHTRDSFEDTYELMAENNSDDLRGVFHCFGGSAEDARKVMDLGGFYMGIGGVSTFKKSHLPELLKEIPLKYLILETDAPYLAPTPYRGKRNQSAYIPLIAEIIAQAKGISVEEVGRQTYENTLKLYQRISPISTSA